MAKPVRVRGLTEQEGQRLQHIVRRGSTSSVRFRRAMMLLASAGGSTVPVIARLVQADEDTVRDVIHKFNEIGLACLNPRWAGGRPRLLDRDDEDFVVLTATTPPDRPGQARCTLVAFALARGSNDGGLSLLGPEIATDPTIVADALVIADWVGKEIGFDLTAELREACAWADRDALESRAQSEAGEPARPALRVLAPQDPHNQGPGRKCPCEVVDAVLDLHQRAPWAAMTDYLQAVFDMLGPAENRYTDPAAWIRLEQEIGRSLPADYKAIVDAYAPVQLNGHLSLSSHPACAWRNLGEEIRSDAEGWNESRAWEEDDLEHDEDPRVICNRPQITFGTPNGLIPLANTDQGAAIFLAPEVHGFPDGIVVQGSEGDWAGHPMNFAEWLYRYLIGEEMAGWDSTALYPGPVLLEYLPTGPDQRTREVYGPERGM